MKMIDKKADQCLASCPMDVFPASVKVKRDAAQRPFYFHKENVLYLSELTTDQINLEKTLFERISLGGEIIHFTILS